MPTCWRRWSAVHVRRQQEAGKGLPMTPSWHSRRTGSQSTGWNMGSTGPLGLRDSHRGWFPGTRGSGRSVDPPPGLISGEPETY